MQREIEALLKSYLQENKREADLIQDVLSALAVGSATRRRMVDAISGAVDRASSEPAAPKESFALNETDIAFAIERLRAVRDSANVH